MERAHVESLRKNLEQARERLSRTAAHKANEGRSAVLDGPVDEAEMATTTYTKEFMFSLSENDAQLLQMVNAALKRMDDGSYGECLSCGNEIGQKRLDAMPWTHLCIACQARAEEMDEMNEAA